MTKDDNSDDDKRRDILSSSDPSLDPRLVELVRSLGRKAAEDDFQKEQQGYWNAETK